MRLYINCCEKCKKKVYLNIAIQSRAQLRRYFNDQLLPVHCSYCSQLNLKSPYDVFAEKGTRTMIVYPLLGSVFAATIGFMNITGIYAPACFFGSLVIGMISELQQRKAVTEFNNS